MPEIQDYLDDIANATYGREVRAAIVGGIEKCYDDLPKRIREINIRDRTPSGNLWGDVNHDGVVTIEDAQMALRYATGIIDTLPDAEAGDLYGTGVINTDTAQRLLHFVDIMQEGDIIAQFEYTYFDGSVEKSCGILNLKGYESNTKEIASIFTKKSTIYGNEWGDADGDGYTTRDDAALVRQYLDGEISSLPNADAADMDRDGTVTEADYEVIHRLVSNRGSGTDIIQYRILYDDGSERYVYGLSPQ